jgi:peptide/nickel transport system substrate-binding protein
MYRFDVGPPLQVAEVERGVADLSVDVALLPGARQAALGTGYYASQLHTAPALFTVYFALNTRVAPFNDVRVRRAINYAFQRRLGAKRWGFAKPSCQILPPGLAGYRPYCPYTTQPNAAGTWAAPDLAKARRLVAASGTKGQKVTVWVLADFISQANLVVSALKQLRYEARLKAVKTSLGSYYALTGNSRRRIQVSGAGFGADYPSASGYISSNFSCRSFRPSTTANTNLSEFCSPSIDAEITRAQALQATDFQAASRLWSKIDRDITNEAPWLVELNAEDVELVSGRVGDYTVNPEWGVLVDRLWVR